MTAPVGRLEPRWRWGRCPRCHGDAWIDTQDPLNVACSRECNGFSIWAFLESVYRWEQEFGDVLDLYSFDAHGRPSNEVPSR